jgi:tryptophanyl-tRNA synthetase
VGDTKATITVQSSGKTVKKVSLEFLVSAHTSWLEAAPL